MYRRYVSPRSYSPLFIGDMPFWHVSPNESLLRVL